MTDFIMFVNHIGKLTPQKGKKIHEPSQRQDPP